MGSEENDLDSLPPKVSGPAQGSLAFSIIRISPKAAYTRSLHPSRCKIKVRWWGQDQWKTLDAPAVGQASVVRYTIRVGLEQFVKYLMDMRKIELLVTDQTGKALGYATALSDDIDQRGVTYRQVLPIYSQRKPSGASNDTEVGQLHLRFMASFRPKELLSSQPAAAPDSARRSERSSSQPPADHRPVTSKPIQSTVQVFESPPPSAPAQIATQPVDPTSVAFHVPPPSVDDRLKQLLARAEALRSTLPAPNTSVPYGQRINPLSASVDLLLDGVPEAIDDTDIDALLQETEEGESYPPPLDELQRPAVLQPPFRSYDGHGLPLYERARRQSDRGFSRPPPSMLESARSWRSAISQIQIPRFDTDDNYHDSAVEVEDSKAAVSSPVAAVAPVATESVTEPWQQQPEESPPQHTQQDIVRAPLVDKEIQASPREEEQPAQPPTHSADAANETDDGHVQADTSRSSSDRNISTAATVPGEHLEVLPWEADKLLVRMRLSSSFELKDLPCDQELTLPQETSAGFQKEDPLPLETTASPAYSSGGESSQVHASRFVEDEEEEARPEANEIASESFIQTRPPQQADDFESSVPRELLPIPAPDDQPSRENEEEEEQRQCEEGGGEAPCFRVVEDEIAAEEPLSARSTPLLFQKPSFQSFLHHSNDCDISSGSSATSSTSELAKPEQLSVDSSRIETGSHGDAEEEVAPEAGEIELKLSSTTPVENDTADTAPERNQPPQDDVQSVEAAAPLAHEGGDDAIDFEDAPEENLQEHAISESDDEREDRRAVLAGTEDAQDPVDVDAVELIPTNTVEPNSDNNDDAEADDSADSDLRDEEVEAAVATPQSVSTLLSRSSSDDSNSSLSSHSRINTFSPAKTPAHTPRRDIMAIFSPHSQASGGSTFITQLEDEPFVLGEQEEEEENENEQEEQQHSSSEASRDADSHSDASVTTNEEQQEERVSVSSSISAEQSLPEPVVFEPDHDAELVAADEEGEAELSQKPSVSPGLSFASSVSQGRRIPTPLSDWFRAPSPPQPAETFECVDPSSAAASSSELDNASQPLSQQQPDWEDADTVSATSDDDMLENDWLQVGTAAVDARDGQHALGVTDVEARDFHRSSVAASEDASRGSAISSKSRSVRSSPQPRHTTSAAIQTSLDEGDHDNSYKEDEYPTVYRRQQQRSQDKPAYNRAQHRRQQMTDRQVQTGGWSWSAPGGVKEEDSWASAASRSGDSSIADKQPEDSYGDRSYHRPRGEQLHRFEAPRRPGLDLDRLRCLVSHDVETAFEASLYRDRSSAGPDRRGAKGSQRSKKQRSKKLVFPLRRFSDRETERISKIMFRTIERYSTHS